MKLTGWGRTDTGRKRSHNEDSFLVDLDCGLFAVADGMGGHRGGATASRMAIEIVRRKVVATAGDYIAAASLIESSPSLMAYADTGAMARPEITPSRMLSRDVGTTTPPIQSEHRRSPSVDFGLEPTLEFSIPPAVIVMRAAAEEASFDIYEAAAADQNLHGMGTTLTALLYDSGRMYAVHAGDSRAYLFRNNTLEQLTEDHTWIAEQIKSGSMTEEEAKTSKYRHVITRSVGFERNVELDSLGVAVEVGDCFVLCSDGMSNHITDSDIEKVLKTTYYRDAPARFIDMANERGGDDNITVIAVYVANELGPEDRPAAASAGAVTDQLRSADTSGGFSAPGMEDTAEVVTPSVVVVGLSMEDTAEVVTPSVVVVGLSMEDTAEVVTPPVVVGMEDTAEVVAPLSLADTAETPAPEPPEPDQN